MAYEHTPYDLDFYSWLRQKAKQLDCGQLILPLGEDLPDWACSSIYSNLSCPLTQMGKAIASHTASQFFP